MEMSGVRPRGRRGPRGTVGVAAWLVGVVWSAGALAACPEPRPTDPGGYNGYTYEGAQVASFGTERVLVWYALSGKHAPVLASTRPDKVPDHVALAAQITDDALAAYEGLGFRPLVADATPGCEGGDGRLDIYLMAFAAADGLTVPLDCVPSGKALRCASFIIAERKPQNRGYASFEVGTRVILPHEAFHAVQNAYDANMDRYWAEGTAQWAAARLDPTLGDLERFLPSFFDDPKRPMDLPPGGVTASFLYGSAIWPVFLDERAGAQVIQGALEAQDKGARAAAAVAESLAAQGKTLADEVTAFRAWNVSTGARAGEGGYSRAGEYPEVPLGDALDGGEASGVLAGLSAAYHPYSFVEPHKLSFSGDEARLRAVAVPIVEGVARLDQIAPLPVELGGEGVVVVAGISEKLSDAPYSVAASALAPPAMPTATSTATAMPTAAPTEVPTAAPTASSAPTAPAPTATGAAGAVGAATPQPADTGADDGCGCSFRASDPVGGWALVAAAAAWWGRARRGRSAARARAVKAQA